MLGGFICMFATGMIYTWSVYVNPMVEALGAQKSDVTLAFSILTMAVPIVMIFASKVLQKRGPRVTCLIGVVLLFAGYFVCSRSTTPAMLYLGFGVLVGSGVGFIYGCPVPTVTSWFPDKKGMVSGILMTAYGVGPILFSTTLSGWISAYGPNRVFLIQGCMAAVGLLIGIPLIKNAPAGYRPEGWTPAAAAAASDIHQFRTKEMLATPQFWMLLAMYLFTNCVGLSITGNGSPISQTMAGLTALQAASIVSIVSVCNSCGRFIAGAASDRIGSRNVISIIFCICVVFCFTFSFADTFLTVTIWLSVLGACFGGMMASYPPMIMDTFGTKYYSTNYAFIFLAYGFGGLASNGIISASLNATETYVMAFYIMGGACLVGAVFSRLVKRPAPRN